MADDYTPSMLAGVTSTNLAGRKPRTADIDLAPARGATADPRLADKPVGQYDANRAKRELSKPIFGKRSVSGRRG